MIEKIKAIFEKYNVTGIKLSEEKPVKMAATAKAKDGSEIATPTEFAVDAEIYVVVEGEPQVAPDGEIEMEDGSVVVVSGGKIAEIKPAVVEEEEMSAEVEAVVSQLAERVSNLEKERDAARAELAAATTKANDLQTKLSASQAEVTKLRAMPAANSVTDKKVELGKVQQETPQKPRHMMTPAERVAAKRAELAAKN